MKLNNPTLAASSTVPGVPESSRWIDDVLESRDRAIEELTTLGQGQVGFDNLNQEIRELKVRHALPIDVRTEKLRGKPRGGIVIGWDIADDVIARPTVINEDIIRFVFFAGSCRTEFFNVTVIIFGS